jgi:hypothetical protein
MAIIQESEFIKIEPLNLVMVLHVIEYSSQGMTRIYPGFEETYDL